ncbi:MAG TPA: hypothetical protein VGR28_13000 [Candidatus Thermoplasmatota archaeon]|jgi:hypothetical protein|nr:hypothetical protein [Candidatus Thermoplasmatota archaeon]
MAPNDPILVQVAGTASSAEQAEEVLRMARVLQFGLRVQRAAARAARGPLTTRTYSF